MLLRRSAAARMRTTRRSASDGSTTPRRHGCFRRGPQPTSTTSLARSADAPGTTRPVRRGCSKLRQQFLDPDRELADPYAGRMPDGIGDGAGAAGDADLADALDAE